MSHAAALQYQCLSQLVPPSAFPVLSTSGPYIRASAAVTVQPLSHVQLSVTPWTAARQASLSFTVSRSLLKLLSTESMMPSNHLILCHPLLLLPSAGSPPLGGGRGSGDEIRRGKGSWQEGPSWSSARTPQLTPSSSAPLGSPKTVSSPCFLKGGGKGSHLDRSALWVCGGNGGAQGATSGESAHGWGSPALVSELTHPPLCPSQSKQWQHTLE